MLNEYIEDYLEAREDELARFITAHEHMDKLREMGRVLCKRQMITELYYRDLQDTLSYVDSTLMIGKHNTAILRNKCKRGVEHERG